MVEEYSAGITTEKFWFVEFKNVINLLESGKTKDEIKQECIENNMFGTDNKYRATRMFGYIFNRVSRLDNTLINLFQSSDIKTQKLIDLISILRNDRLFFEFIYEVYREKIILGENEINYSDAKSFLREKALQSDEVDGWKESTLNHIKSDYLNFLTDAGLLNKDGRKFTITPPLMDIALERYLKANGEGDIVKAFTGVK